MNICNHYSSGFPFRCLVLLIFGWITASALSFPPTPHHTIYGIVRDEMGNPLAVEGAEVILETLAGMQIKAAVSLNLGPGMNYRIRVPMDAGLTSDNYKPNALRPTVAFRIKVKIGQVVYLPIELKGNYANLGKPAQNTHLDLTLGEDSDGDGLPDAWERALIQMSGGNLTLKDIQGNLDSDGDGLTNSQEYQIGTYAFDSKDGLRIDVSGMSKGRPMLAFTVIYGRTYVIEGSSDLQTWTPVLFRITEEGPILSSYVARDVRLIHAVVADPLNGKDQFQFFRLVVQ